MKLSDDWRKDGERKRKEEEEEMGKSGKTTGGFSLWVGVGHSRS